MSGVGSAHSARLAAVLLIAGLLVAGCTSLVGGTASRAPTQPQILSTSVTPSSTAVTPTRLPSLSSAAPTPQQDRPHATSPAPIPTAANPEDPHEVQLQHDAAFASLMATLTSTLKSGNARSFLAPFAPSLTDRVRHWFDNTRDLGVAAAELAPADDYSTAATDSARSFTRTVVVGVRTPYDDDDSMPGIVYSAAVSVRSVAGKQILQITSWQPKYVDDPMFCTCMMTVAHDNGTAVVADAADGQLDQWSAVALDSTGGIAWSRAQLSGSGLTSPRGQVIFLADRPFHWFLTKAGPGQTSNVTAGLLDAAGRYPGTRYSPESRIVLMLQAADGSMVPNDDTGRQYVADVITHESTHQLMNRNSTLPGRSPNSPPTWVVEGIAVAVETLYRDSLGDGGDVGYPEPNDPKNIAGSWFAAHLTANMPTPSQLYSSASDGAGYYAISGSVFRYLFREYGYVEMMKVAKDMYAKPAQSPFSYFPDRDHPGSDLPAATAKSLWKNWFVAHYE